MFVKNKKQASKQMNIFFKSEQHLDYDIKKRRTTKAGFHKYAYTSQC